MAAEVAPLPAAVSLGGAMSARRFVPGAGSRVTEVRHTRPRRGLLRRRRRRFGPSPPRPPPIGQRPGGEAAASSRAPRRAARLGRAPPAGPPRCAPRAAGLGKPGGGAEVASWKSASRVWRVVFAGEGAFWMASLDAVVRLVLCCLGGLVGPDVNDQKGEFLA